MADLRDRKSMVAVVTVAAATAVMADGSSNGRSRNRSRYSGSRNIECRPDRPGNRNASTSSRHHSRSGGSKLHNKFGGSRPPNKFGVNNNRSSELIGCLRGRQRNSSRHTFPLRFIRIVDEVTVAAEISERMWHRGAEIGFRLDRSEVRKYTSVTRSEKLRGKPQDPMEGNTSNPTTHRMLPHRFTETTGLIAMTRVRDIRSSITRLRHIRHTNRTFRNMFHHIVTRAVAVI